MRFVVRFIANTVAIGVAAWLFRPHLEFASFYAILLAAVLLGILNSTVRPLLRLLTLPLNLITLGLFTLVLNAAILMLLAWIMGELMNVENFGWAVLAALVISVIASLMNILTGGRRSKPRRRRY
jgi:putative membrane protein